jgi:hypothetical protein
MACTVIGLGGGTGVYFLEQYEREFLENPAETR